jgi:hypothetical protein
MMCRPCRQLLGVPSQSGVGQGERQGPDIARKKSAVFRPLTDLLG